MKAVQREQLHHDCIYPHFSHTANIASSNSTSILLLHQFSINFTTFLASPITDHSTVLLYIVIFVSGGETSFSLPVPSTNQPLLRSPSPSLLLSLLPSRHPLPLPPLLSLLATSIFSRTIQAQVNYFPFVFFQRSNNLLFDFNPF